ncbi:MAG: glycosyltransferase family 4 protein [Actinobacteria bacterium]|nr:glycosyltransferase family 4 protein [Actinomycetota bacterium]
MAPASPSSLRVALLAYRGNPLSGGQGVYTRYLSRELTELGHRVTVFSGQPYPRLDEGVELVEVPSLDLYREPDPFRVPWPNEFRSWTDFQEFLVMCTGAFPEPRTYAKRLWKLLRHRRHDFDLVHDNQCLAPGIVKFQKAGWPLLTTVHHPITVDRDLDLQHAPNLFRKTMLRRWYSFLHMQKRVIRKLDHIVTVSESSRRDIAAQLDVDPARMGIVPVGVDVERFRPLPHIERVPGRLMTTTSSDVPMKGLVYLLEALAKVRTERDVELVVIGKPREGGAVAKAVTRLGLHDCVRFMRGIDDERLVELYAEAELAVVPSLYEGFSLPAVEAMACGVPLLGTTGGAIPEVVGEHGVTGLLVPSGDAEALAAGIRGALDDQALRDRIGDAGRRRVLDRFTWRATAEGTAHFYQAVIAHTAGLDGPLEPGPVELSQRLAGRSALAGEPEEEELAC